MTPVFRSSAANWMVWGQVVQGRVSPTPHTHHFLAHDRAHAAGAREHCPVGLSTRVRVFGSLGPPLSCVVSAVAAASLCQYPSPACSLPEREGC